MRAVVLSEFGGPDVLRWQDAPDPVAGPGQILVKVEAAGINRADLVARSGQYPQRSKRGGIYFYPFDRLPATPGIEVAGTVAAVGAGAEGVAVGDRVCGICSTGGYAEYATMLDWLALPIPDGVSFAEAASLPAACLTSWIALCELANVRPGEVALIHAAGSAVGVTAIQIAVMIGATVYGTAGSADKLARAAALGMTDGFNYRVQDFAQALAGRPVDVVMDNVGGDTFSRSLDIMGVEGRIVVLSSTAGRTPPIDLGRMVAGHLRVFGMSMAAMLTPDRLRRFRREVMAAVPGKIRPVVDRTYPLTQAPAAHEYVASNANFGKVVLVAS